MKVYSQKMVDQLIRQACERCKSEIAGACINEVQNRLDSMSMARDIADLKALEERIQTLELSNFYTNVGLREPPKPKHNAARRRVAAKL